VESPTNNIIRSERQERLSFYDKLSTVGGILGLCNGMSALSIAECLLMICTLFYALLRIVGKRLNFICKTEKLNTTDSAEFKNDDDESDDESDEDLWLQLVELHVSLILIIFLVKLPDFYCLIVISLALYNIEKKTVNYKILQITT
jgi:hypothetical protein